MYEHRRTQARGTQEVELNDGLLLSFFVLIGSKIF